jgi:DIS3-like exonuclease 2
LRESILLQVVAIIERKHSRASTGHIALMNDKNPNTALFKPLDHRLPRIMIPMDNCPKGMYSNTQLYKGKRTVLVI